MATAATLALQQILDGLNDRQREAVEYTGGPLLVLAGPGTGKTRVLTHCVAYTIAQEVFYPAEVVMITFTIKAAIEMRERIEALLEGRGWDTEKIIISTIHSLAYRIVYAENNRKPITVVDEHAALKLIAAAVKQVGLDPRVWDVKSLARDIALAKDHLQSPDDLLARGRPPYVEIGQVYKRYQAALEEKHSLDFDDLIIKAIKILEADESLRQAYQRPFVLVDEYQDTSMAQYRFVKSLVGPQRNLACVGSPVQSIYGFRGADPAYLVSVFRQDFPDAKEVILTDHYRCAGNILAAASTIVNGKYPDARNLQPMRDEGSPVFLARFNTEIESAEYVARQIRAMYDADAKRYTHWNDYCVLYRTNSQGIVLQEALNKLKIPFTLAEKQRTVWERDEISHLLSYAAVAVNNGDNLALEKIVNAPPRGIGSGTLKKIKQGHHTLTLDLLAEAMSMDLKPHTLEAIIAFITLVTEDLPEKAKTLPPTEFLDYVLQATGYRDWIAEDWNHAQKVTYLRYLHDIAAEYDTVADFVAATKEAMETQVETPRGVMLSTLHAAKGLEFPVVFIVGMDQGVLPSKAALRLHKDPPEERRLCYVGMTRAKDLLYLVGERTLGTNGQSKNVRPSLYLADIPSRLTRRVW